MLDQLKNPQIQYRLAPIWVWNRLPDLEEIEKQVREMHRKGSGGFFIENRAPQRVGGLGEELLNCIETASYAAQRLGMQIYEADEASSAGNLSAMLEMKLQSSRAHANGRVRVHSRIRGQGWDQGLEDLKRDIDLQTSLGASFFSPDAFYYSIAGTSLALATPSQFYQTTYWRHYKLFADYASRLCYVMTQGRHCAQAVVIRPGSFEDALAGDMAEWLEAISECLLAQHVDFDILDEDTLCKAQCVENRLTLNDESYELVILPPMPAIACDAAMKLCAFAEEEGKVIAFGPVPAEDSRGDRHSTVREAFGVMREISSELFLDVARPDDVSSAMGEALRAAIKPDISIRRGSEECQDVTAIHRRLDGVDVFFLANHAGEAREVRISVRCDGAPHLVNLESGDVTALPNCTQQGNRTVLLHRLERYGSLMMAFSNEPAWSVAPPIIDEGQEITLSDEWEFEAEQPNCIALPDWAFNTLIQADKEIYEYVTSFEAEATPESLMLMLEEQPEFGTDAERVIFVNGLQIRAQESWIVDIGLRTLDISSLVQVGTNTVRMLVNRQGWTGDPVTSPSRARLMGAFCVDAGGKVLRERSSVIRNGSWTDQGYPYYSGTAIYGQIVYIPEFARGQRVVLRAENPAGMVEFLVNGAIASVRPWAPYETDITALVKPGPNEIEMRVINSLANMLLLQPKPSGLLGGAIALLA